MKTKARFILIQGVINIIIKKNWAAIVLIVVRLLFLNCSQCKHDIYEEHLEDYSIMHSIIFYALKSIHLVLFFFKIRALTKLS